MFRLPPRRLALAGFAAIAALTLSGCSALPVLLLGSALAASSSSVDRYRGGGAYDADDLYDSDDFYNDDDFYGYGDGGGTPDGTWVELYDLNVGDCLNSSVADDSSETVPVVPCGELHEDEVYFAFDLVEGPFPGYDVIDAAVEDRCMSEFEAFVGEPYEESPYDWFPYSPSDTSWAFGDREVLCLAYYPGGDVVGSLAGSGRNQPRDEVGGAIAR